MAGLNEALRAKAAEARLLRTARVRADTTVIAVNMPYLADAGLLARAVGKLVRAARRDRDGDEGPAAGGSGLHGPALVDMDFRMKAKSNFWSNIVSETGSIGFVEGLVRATGRGFGR